MAGVSVVDVTRDFDGSPVLDGLDLEIPRGQFLAIVGRSGSGKSTLLRLLAGLDQPDTGTIRASDRLAVAFQEPRLLPWLTVAGNVGFGLSRAGRAEVVARALSEVGLSDRSRAWPLTLSGGQAQRVSLARAVVRDPQLVLLDEPFGALDALTRIDAQNLVSRLAAEHGWTVVMVTHDVTEALRLADRVVVLGEGRIIADVDVPGVGPRPLAFDGEAELAERILGHLGVAVASGRGADA